MRLITLPPSCSVVMESGNLNFLEPSGPLQVCNGTALPLRITGRMFTHSQMEKCFLQLPLLSKPTNFISVNYIICSLCSHTPPSSDVRLRNATLSELVTHACQTNSRRSETHYALHCHHTAMESGPVFRCSYDI